MSDPINPYDSFLEHPTSRDEIKRMVRDTVLILPSGRLSNHPYVKGLITRILRLEMQVTEYEHDLTRRRCNGMRVYNLIHDEVDFSDIKSLINIIHEIRKIVVMGTLEQSFNERSRL